MEELTTEDTDPGLGLPSRGRPKASEAQGREHPTRQTLIDATRHLLSKRPNYDPTVDEILVASGVSKGSLYHHFENGHHLIDEALLLSFSEGVDENIAQIEEALRDVSSREEAALTFRLITVVSQSSALRARRGLRMRVLGRADEDSVFAQKLLEEQNRLNNALTQQIKRMQDRGWVRNDFEAAAGSLLIQAYSIGRKVGQITDDLVSENAWNTVIFRIIEQGLMGLPIEVSAQLDAGAELDPQGDIS